VQSRGADEDTRKVCERTVERDVLQQVLSLGIRFYTAQGKKFYFHVTYISTVP